MREMKDSGIPWIGKIPKRWEIIKGKYILTYLQRPILSTDKVITCFRDGEVTLRSNRREEGFTISEKEIGYQGIDVGDLVVHGMDGFAGSIGISDSRGKASPVLNVLNSSQDKKFLMYYLRSMAYNNVFLALSTGIRVRSCDLNWNKLANLPYAIPPIQVQHRIADFLDAKCAKIDSIKKNVESEIEALKQYKQSVITEAVTKGLDKNVKMKDSGIPWCPRIPKHWVPTNPKALFHQRKERARENDKQLTASQKHGIVFQDDFMKIENQKVVTVAKDFDILKHVEPNDFVISMRSFQGGLEFSELSGCISSAYVMLVPNCNLVYPPFYRWLFKSDKYINAIQSTTNLIRDGQAMRFANFVMVPLFIIPLDEQQRIAGYLNKKCSKIDSIIQKKQELLANLDTYKKSLIYEYVTGKKEVPAV